jgi:hypothetical protein
MKNNLVRFWSCYTPTAAPYFHPKDKETLFNKNGNLVTQGAHSSYEQYLKSPEFSHLDTSKFHLSLLPMPYGGNLDKADIFFLLLNPGLTHSDYYGELKQADYRRTIINNLHQKMTKADFPFLWLDPSFCWHGGFLYWERKLRGVLKTIAEKKYDGSYIKALRDLSHRIAMIEMFPYHSVSFGAAKLAKKLPSSIAAVEYVRKVLEPEAKTGEKTLIVLRQEKEWGLKDDGKNIIVYKGTESRSAHLSPNSRGGRAILQRYKI